MLPPFCSIQVLSGLDDAKPFWGGPSAILSPPIPMWTSLDTPEITLNQISGPSQVDT